MFYLFSNMNFTVMICLLTAPSAISRKLCPEVAIMDQHHYVSTDFPEDLKQLIKAKQAEVTELKSH